MGFGVKIERRWVIQCYTVGTGQRPTAHAGSTDLGQTAAPRMHRQEDRANPHNQHSHTQRQDKRQAARQGSRQRKPSRERCHSETVNLKVTAP